MVIVGKPEPEVKPKGIKEELSTPLVKQFTIEYLNGTKLTKVNISYPELKKLVEKMEMLC